MSRKYKRPVVSVAASLKNPGSSIESFFAPPLSSLPSADEGEDKASDGPVDRATGQAAIQPKSAEEYESVIECALSARLAAYKSGNDDGSSITTDENGVYVHPTGLIFRVGIRSIREGKASESFLALLERFAAMAEAEKGAHDVLIAAFPNRVGAINPRTIKAANDQRQIVGAWLAHLKGIQYDKSATPGRNVARALRTFKRVQWGLGGPATLRRALKLYGYFYPARKAHS